MRLLWFNLRVDRDRQGLAFAIDWLNTIAAQIDHIDVITMYAGRYQVRENVRVYSVGKEKGYSEPRRAVEFYRILGWLLWHHRYDACFAHMMPLFAVMGSPLLRFKHIPIGLWYTHKSVTLILRLATLLVNRVVTASKESFRVKSRKVRVIGHGIDTDRFVPGEHRISPQRPFTILSVSRLSAIKRIDLLIHAVALLHQRKPEFPVCLKIAGGPLTAKDQQYVVKLKQQVKQYGLQKVVNFVGSVHFQEIVPYYQHADCFVNMSETGSIDKVVLEAMSCGAVVIARQTYAEVFGDKLASMLIVSQDAGQLCDRLLQIASLSQPERRRLGEELRAIVVRDHALSKLCTRIVHELKGLISEDEKE